MPPSAASHQAGDVELHHNEILVLGNAEGSASDLVIAHDVMEDAIDQAAVRRALHAAGCEHAMDRIVGVYAKAEASPSGRIRSRRHTMIDDSDINHTRHARAVVSAVIASVVGDPMVYVSGGAEHQGPSGGGPVAVIARRARSPPPKALSAPGAMTYHAATVPMSSVCQTRGMRSVTNWASLLLTALPLASASAFLVFFAHVRFTLGRWPVVYRDNPHGWLIDVEEVLATLTYLAAVAAIVLWPVASGLATLFLGRSMFFRRLFVFLAGWALLCSLFVFDPTGSLEWFLD